MLENEKDKRSDRFVVAVMSRDRVGIVRDVTSAISKLKANIERVSQTVVMNYFTLTLVVTFPEVHTSGEIRELLCMAGAEGEFEVSVKAFERGVEEAVVVSDGDRFVLTVTGADQIGIIGQIAAYLAGKGINIIDLYASKPDPQHFVMISELAVPSEMDASQIQIDIETLGRKKGLTAALQHENIFKATNEVTAPANFS